VRAALIETVDLHKEYQMGGAALHALRGVSLRVAAGEFVAVMGPSGSGKSTLINLLGLLDRPSAGRYLLDGSDLSDLDADRRAALRNRSVGFVFQTFNLLARSTALENVALPLIYAGVARAEQKLRAAAALEVVGLAQRVAHWPHQLSGGEQQRVAIARALVSDPALILADEPTGALDSRTGLEIMACLQGLNRAGRTVVLVTHDHGVARHAGRIVSMQDGRVIDDAPVLSPTDARAAADGRSHTRHGGRAAFASRPAERSVSSLESLRVAIRALRANALRSALAMLGIVIGVAAVITMVAIGGGAQGRVLAQIRSLGANLLIVTPGSAVEGTVRLGGGTRPTLTEDDAAAIVAEVPSVRVAAPAVDGSAHLVRGNQYVFELMRG
jgi:macrolide transport system ATP-binding/permease protein